MEGSFALVVSEDAEVRSALSHLLADGGFKTVTASSAQQALGLMTTVCVTIVLYDWSVSGLSAADFCKKMRGATPERYVYLIFIGSEVDVSAKLAIQAGADAFISTPFQSEDVNARLMCATRIIELQERMTSRNDFLEYAYASVTTDLKIAAKVQEDLLPRQFRLAGLDTNWFFKPANFVAGDIFDYFPLADDYFVFYILDVEGHGIASALTSFAINNQLNPSSLGLCAKSLKNNETVPDAVIATVQDLNRQFESNLSSSRYFTMIYGVIDVSTGQVTMTQAGHPAPIHLSKQSGKAKPLGDGGMPVGLLTEASYSTIDCQLAVGDRLYLYSDGMIECENENGEFYGSDRLLEKIQKHQNLPISVLGELFDGEIASWNGTGTFDDDVSMVVLEYTGVR